MTNVRDGAMSTSTQKSKGSSLPELRTGPLIAGAALAGAGTLLVLAGLSVGGSHLLLVTRRWILQMEVAPSGRGRTAGPGWSPRPAAASCSHRPPAPAARPRIAVTAARPAPG